MYSRPLAPEMLGSNKPYLGKSFENFRVCGSMPRLVEILIRNFSDYDKLSNNDVITQLELAIENQPFRVMPVDS